MPGMYEYGDRQDEAHKDPSNEGRFADGWAGSREDTGEKRFARAMIQRAVQDHAAEWFSTDMAEVLCLAVGLEPEAIVREMRRRAA